MWHLLEESQFERLSEVLSERGLLTVDTTFYSFDQLEQAYEDLRQGKLVGRGVITFD
jgi:propanol-preferring alcohol dehydrogenase